MKKILSLLLPALLLTAETAAQPAVTDANPPKFAPKNVPEFRFGGGNLRDFLSAIRDTFGVDLQAMGTVPQSMLHSVQVPKMRTEGHGGILDFRHVLNLYNQISADGASLGQWIIKGDYKFEPEAIVLVHGARASASFLVKAFAIPNPKTKHDDFFEKLHQIIGVQRATLMDKPYPGLSTSDLEGRLEYHGQAGIIVATGGEVYVEMVTTVFEALKERAEKERLL